MLKTDQKRGTSFLTPPPPSKVGFGGYLCREIILGNWRASTKTMIKAGLLKLLGHSCDWHTGVWGCSSHTCVSVTCRVAVASDWVTEELSHVCLSPGEPCSCICIVIWQKQTQHFKCPISPAHRLAANETKIYIEIKKKKENCLLNLTDAHSRAEAVKSAWMRDDPV